MTSGDPGLLGWLTTVLYAVAALLCFRAALTSTGRARTFWCTALLLLAALGINKQLDVQTLVRHAARTVMQINGWYGYKRVVEIAGIGILAAFAAAALFIARRISRDDRMISLAALGLGLLGFFVVLRASSVGNADSKVGALLRPAVHILEWAAIVLVGGAAAVARRAQKP